MTVELKNDLCIMGTLKSVDQYVVIPFLDGSNLIDHKEAHRAYLAAAHTGS